MKVFQRKDKNPSKLFFHDHLVDLKNKTKQKITVAMPKFLIVMCICGNGIFATVTVLRGTPRVP